jgi:hypothetical protein
MLDRVLKAMSCRYREPTSWHFLADFVAWCAMWIAARDFVCDVATRGPGHLPSSAATFAATVAVWAGVPIIDRALLRWRDRRLAEIWAREGEDG